MVVGRMRALHSSVTDTYMRRRGVQLSDHLPMPQIAELRRNDGARTRRLPRR